VGKSLLVAGLCRALANRGLRVLPFKPQNMSNNAAVTPEGGEIGRAQALQAMAARAPACGHEPRAAETAGRPHIAAYRAWPGARHAGQRLFPRGRRSLLPEVLESFARLEAACDIVVVEGAGSPAEINLRDGDIANMGFAAAGVPVVLVGDIDRGGVIAAVVGTRAVLDPDDAAMIRGFIINKFRGDPSLFADGYQAIAQRSGWRGFGVVPWLGEAVRLPSEDAVVLEQRRAVRRAPAGGLPDPAAHRQFRRSGPAEDRAGRGSGDDRARHAHSGRSGADRAARFKGHAGRYGR
jgi:adenosylcobyric acid synthase